LTDHQPLTFAVSEKNTNSKIKRWKAFIEEHNAKIHYKAGKENFVADPGKVLMLYKTRAQATRRNTYSI